MCSTVLRLSVWGPSGPISGSRLVRLLRNQLLREKSDYLLFRVLRVDTVCEFSPNKDGRHLNASSTVHKMTPKYPETSAAILCWVELQY